MRSLRQELAQAIAAGDRAAADALQAQLLESMRQDRPRTHTAPAVGASPTQNPNQTPTFLSASQRTRSAPPSAPGPDAAEPPTE